MRTMYEACKICAPITLMTFAIFTRSDMVVNPGWPEIWATLLVLAGTSGVAFALFGRFVENLAVDVVLRVALAAVSFLVLFFPDSESGSKALFTLGDFDLLGVSVPAGVVPIAAAAVVAAVLFYGTLRYQRIAQPPATVRTDERVVAGDASDLIAEAKRELG
jgi:hypothetical protein